MQSRGFIDVSASFGSEAGRSRGRPLSAMLAEQRSHGIILSLAHSRVAVDFATGKGNADALDVAADPGNRTRAIAVIDASISRGADLAIAEWARRGAAGFWLESREAPVWLESDTAAPRLRAIAATGRPLLVPLTSASAHPSAASAVGRATADLGIPVIFVGVHYTNAVEALEAAQRYPNLHVETSAMAHFGGVEMAVDRIGHERVLFGSGGPGRAHQSPINMILLAEISDHAKRAILAGNAARLFGLDTPAEIDITPPALPSNAFDVHSHYMPASAYDVPVVSDEALLTELQRWGTTTLASSSFNAFAADLVAGNRETAEFSARPGGQGGLLVMDPGDYEASAEHLRRWQGTPGIHGAKIHSFYADVPTADRRMADVFRLLAEREMPVKIHNNGPDWHVALGSYARQYPRLRILLAHSGPGAPSIDAARLAAEHDNVFLELASSFANVAVMRQLVEIAGAVKIAWGTDAPLLDPRFILGSYMDAGLGPEQAPDVYRANGVRIFPTAA